VQYDYSWRTARRQAANGFLVSCD